MVLASRRPIFPSARRTSRAWAYTSFFVVASLLAYLILAFYITGEGLAPAASLALAGCHPQKYHPSFASYHLEQLRERPPFVGEAAAVADQIKLDASQAGQDGTPTAVLFLSNSKYQARFDEMINTWSRFADRSSLVMAALDNSTAAYFQERGIKTIRVQPEDLKPEGSIREAVLQTKVVIPYVFLLKGLRVVMVEMDIYCRSNPLRLDNGTAEVLVSEHNNTNEVNVGFWIAYPTCAVIDAFRRMIDWIMDPDRAHAYCDSAFDQKFMHFAWLGDGPMSMNSGTACQVFAQRDRLFDPRAHTPLKLERISYEQIMHWTNPPDPEAWPSNSSNPMCVHIWSSFGPGTAQARYGYRRGWFPVESKKEAEEALRQLDLLEGKNP